MQDRLKSLQRLLAVQKDMHRLAEWRFAQLERKLHVLGEEQKRLLSYLDNENLMALSLSKPIFDRLRALDIAKDRLTRERNEQRARMLENARRMGQMENAADAAAETSRRDDEKRELAAAIEAALNQKGASFR